MFFAKLNKQVLKISAALINNKVEPAVRYQLDVFLISVFIREINSSRVL